MNELHEQRMREISSQYVGETPPPGLPTRQKNGLPGRERACSRHLARNLCRDGRCRRHHCDSDHFAPSDADAGAVSWRRTTLEEISLASGEPGWEQIWRIGWTPGSEVGLAYSNGKSLMPTAPSTSSTSREFGDR